MQNFTPLSFSAAQKSVKAKIPLRLSLSWFEAGSWQIPLH